VTNPFASLSNRIFLASAALAVVAIGVATFVVNRVVTRQAETDLERGLVEVASLFDQYRAQHFTSLIRDARLIADIPILKAAVATNHALTVESIARNYQQELDADLFLVTSREGTPLAVIGDPGVARAAIAQAPPILLALSGRAAVSYWPRRGGVLQVVSFPIWIEPVPDILGTLSVGFSLDAQLASRFKQVTQAEILFASDDTVHASTLASGTQGVSRNALKGGGISRLTIGDEEYVGVAKTLSIAPQGGAIVETAGPQGTTIQPTAIVLRSRTERLRPLSTVHTLLMLTAVLSVLLATLSSYAVARTITRPLRAVTAAMRDLAATGDPARARPPLAAGRWDDEDARVLAGTFETLTASLARFQREATQRERLSSLGRFSTVLAHEIRNPLMIIKASLRALRRRFVGADASDARAAGETIRDIEDEVQRLDRLVNEVLDYARPIRYDYGRVSLNALCRDAATAVNAGHDLRISVSVPEDPVDIVSDGDRLRVALVNVLANARDAILATRTAVDLDRPGRPGSQMSTNGHDGFAPDIELAVIPRDGERVAVSISDRGPGIPPEDLPRIFEPYFTTRRAGSGLGLPLARNIVEGLGGTIEVASQAGRGTSVRLDLPLDASRYAAQHA
jgi:signal transduction histidine kinase